MLRRVVFAAVGCAILVIAGSQSVLASDDVGRFRVGGLFGIAMADHEDLNDTIDDVKNFWTEWEIDVNGDDVGGGPALGVFAEYLVSDRFAVGAEFTRLSGSGGYDWSFDEEYGSVALDVGYEATGSVASLYGVYRLPLGDSPVTLRFGAGAGYLFGAKFVMDFRGHEVYQDRGHLEGSRDTTIVSQTDVEASGSGVAFHGLVGAEYHLTDQWLLMASASYRIARVDELKVDEASSKVNGVPVDVWWDLEEGETLKWCKEDGVYFSTEDGDDVGLDFGGVQFTVSVAYAF